jgi:multicomponent Na+:H+ antiporter subunit B
MSDAGMSKIVKTMSGVCFPFVVIFGLYVIIHGHLTPGGGFQGGAVVASACAMILIAYGSVWTMKKVKEKHLSIFESLGAIMFISLAFFGILLADQVFFDNFILSQAGFLFAGTGEGLSNINTAGVIPLMNIAVGLKVIAGLFAIVLVMAYATHKIKGGDA